MKKILITSLALVGSVGLCSMASAAILGSAHDFTAFEWAHEQICLPCHAPHNNDNAAGEVLWNHAITGAIFTLYSSPTLDAGLVQPTGISKFCLSCHDGTVAIDSFGGVSGGTMIGDIEVDANLGTNLNNDHPVSFIYDSSLASVDGGLFDPVTTASGMETGGEGGTIDEDMLFDGSLECASCHDVHNKYSQDSLLNVSNEGSGLCLICHDK